MSWTWVEWTRLFLIWFDVVAVIVLCFHLVSDGPDE